MIRILTDSASDILPAEAEQLGVTVIPPERHALEDGTVLRDGVDMTPTEYYGIPSRVPQAAHHQPAQPGAVREVLSGSRCRRGRSAGHLPVPRAVRHMAVRQSWPQTSPM